MTEKNSIGLIDFWKFLESGDYTAVYNSNNQMIGKIINRANEVVYWFKYNSIGLYQLIVV